MNALRYTPAILIALFLFSCDSGQDDHQNQLEKSEKNWQVLKSENGESYRYQVSTSSWTGYSSITTITVLKGLVTKREFQSYLPDNEGGQELVYSYVEEGEKIGADTEGAEPITLDELYDVCKEEYLTVDPNSNTIYFTEFDNGLVKSCGYVPQNCVDDCFFGFSLKIIEWLE
ncbi:hypothetical protein IFO69_04725 [Echinicola sp. CAU 1574]|uniref:Uncharacterized protein n=1 Tax=Echinicola arenosa TaxID=2774144 RepID=A0ABR9AKB0_9BACT|nr:hypothetical protein [Echinicola arenosa]MBD8488044.1 hypothetical protein [Echinicola arenosa]